MDGLGTNISLVAGVGGAGASAHTIVLSGVAGLIAGAFSMALGEFTSVSTQNEQLDAEVAAERNEIEKNPRGELTNSSTCSPTWG
ncbi:MULTISPECIES: VIT1/CCC1 transporter family protein [Gordonia]|uniref:VIT1/CCC1 transporter family protein n=1 Tax=Gordonia TaxID=2053 RepID=UPI0022B75F94|nr:VIT1/CCC1 transporter family protein [Gordonia sp. 1D]